MPISKNNARLPEQLLADLASYIDRHYAPPFDLEILAPHECCSAQVKGYQEKQRALRGSRPTKSLEHMLRQMDAGFSETLLHMIDESGQKDAVIYKRAGLSKQHFSKIRKDAGYKPTKATAIALALALELNVQQTNDLIGRAGFTLSNSSKFDLIIRYFIEQGIFDIIEINMALYEFDQPLLGG